MRAPPTDDRAAHPHPHPHRYRLLRRTEMVSSASLRHLPPRHDHFLGPSRADLLAAVLTAVPSACPLPRPSPIHPPQPPLSPSHSLPSPGLGACLWRGGSVLYYQEAIFIDAGFESAASSAAVIVGAAKLVATLVAVAYVDRFGRRPLLFVGIAMMLGALLLLGSAFYVGSPSLIDPRKITLAPGWPPIVVAALVLYVCGCEMLGQHTPKPSPLRLRAIH